MKRCFKALPQRLCHGRVLRLATQLKPAFFDSGLWTQGFEQALEGASSSNPLKRTGLACLGMKKPQTRSGTAVFCLVLLIPGAQDAMASS